MTDKLVRVVIMDDEIHPPVYDADLVSHNPEYWKDRITDVPQSVLTRYDKAQQSYMDACTELEGYLKPRKP